MSLNAVAGMLLSRILHPVEVVSAKSERDGAHVRDIVDFSCAVVVDGQTVGIKSATHRGGGRKTGMSCISSAIAGISRARLKSDAMSTTNKATTSKVARSSQVQHTGIYKNDTVKVC